MALCFFGGDNYFTGTFFAFFERKRIVLIYLVVVVLVVGQGSR